MADGIKKVSENVIVNNRALIITNPSVPDNDAISIGALQSDPALRGLKIKTSKGVYSLLDASKMLADLSITNNLLGPGCVTSNKIASNAVGHDQIADDSICKWKMQIDSVTSPAIENGAVIKGKLGEKAVENKNLENSCVHNINIKQYSIEDDRHARNSITKKSIAFKTIDNNCLDDKSVANSNLIDNTIKYEKYEDQSIYGNKIKKGGIENIHMAQNSVNTINLMNGSVNHLKISEKSIYEYHINENQILNKHILPGEIKEGSLDVDSVTTTKIKDKNVTKSKLGEDVLDYIGDPVQYDKDNNVNLRQNLSVPGNITAGGTIKADKIYNAVFMDIAEAYIPAPNVTFVPGDIVEVREDGFAYKADGISVNKAIVGVVSNEYAQCFGATEEELTTNKKIAVGMIGKVHVNVVGPVKIGEYIGACKDGIGVSKNIDLSLSDKYIIGKALESNDSNEPKKVLCLIFPN